MSSIRGAHRGSETTSTTWSSTRVDDTTEDVDEDVGDHHQEGEHEHRGLQQDEVLLLHRLIRELADARPGEDDSITTE